MTNSPECPQLLPYDQSFVDIRPPRGAVLPEDKKKIGLVGLRFRDFSSARVFVEEAFAALGITNEDEVEAMKRNLEMAESEHAGMGGWSHNTNNRQRFLIDSKGPQGYTIRVSLGGNMETPMSPELVDFLKSKGISLDKK
jgi:hypothetical protein